VQADGKILVGGWFTGVLRRLNVNGTEDSAFSTNVTPFDDSPFSFAVQPDGKIVLGGTFSGSVKRLAGNVVAAAPPFPGINPTNALSDGTEDTVFATASSGALDGIVQTAAMQADGKTVVGGYFSGHLKRLNVGGSEDTAFASHLPTFDGTVFSVAVESDG